MEKVKSVLNRFGVHLLFIVPVGFLILTLVHQASQ